MTIFLPAVLSSRAVFLSPVQPLSERSRPPSIFTMRSVSIDRLGLLSYKAGRL